MARENMFQRDPRGFVIELVENGLDAQDMLERCLDWMSHDDVRGMLDANEMSPRFDEDEDEETEDPMIFINVIKELF